MKNTLQSLLAQCLEETKRSDSGADLSTYPSQILCLCEEIAFTQQCESSITNNRLKNLKSSLKVQHNNKITPEVAWKYLQARLDGLTSFVTKNDEEYSNILILKIRALILVLIHNISIVDSLIDSKKSLSLESWAWKKQLRCEKFFTSWMII